MNIFAAICHLNVFETNYVQNRSNNRKSVKIIENHRWGPTKSLRICVLSNTNSLFVGNTLQNNVIFMSGSLFVKFKKQFVKYAEFPWICTSKLIGSIRNSHDEHIWSDLLPECVRDYAQNRSNHWKSMKIVENSRWGPLRTWQVSMAVPAARQANSKCIGN